MNVSWLRIFTIYFDKAYSLSANLQISHFIRNFQQVLSVIAQFSQSWEA